MNRWMWACLCGWLAAVGFATEGHAQIQRDRFVAVKAEELATAPQRYWSRGIVFEDTLEEVTGRRRRLNGRSVVQVESREVGRFYVDASVIDKSRGLATPRRYLFAGTVTSESGRTVLMRPETRYMVVADFVEPLLEDVKGDLLSVFLGAESRRPAYQNVQKAVAHAQNQLVAFAQNESVAIETLFDAGAERMDKAAEVSRVAVRAVEQELGITSTELLSMLVRELLAAQYVDQLDEPEPENKPAPKNVERVVPDEQIEPPEEVLENPEGAIDAGEVTAFDGIDEDEAVEEQPRRRFWQRNRAPEQDAPTPVVEESSARLDDADDAYEAPRRRFWQRNRAADLE